MKRIAYLATATLLLFSCSKEANTDNTPEARPIEAIDLGLSVKWANYNLGATTSSKVGDYYAWGETVTKSDYSWSTYKWGKSATSLTKYNNKGTNGTVDNKKVLDPEDDVAHVKLGGKWRIPTDAEWKELLNKCTWEKEYYEYKVTSKINGKTIYLPITGFMDNKDLMGQFYGFYWSSSINTDQPDYAWLVLSTGTLGRNYSPRYYGFTVRPVCEK